MSMCKKGQRVRFTNMEQQQKVQSAAKYFTQEYSPFFGISYREKVSSKYSVNQTRYKITLMIGTTTKIWNILEFNSQLVLFQKMHFHKCQLEKWPSKQNYYITNDYTKNSVVCVDKICIHQARLAQSVEHETLNLRVVGSSPTLGAVF